jgi:2-polyprenyl-3-methyl-5-hydroxy-6-metoxy-1,4-benzoquinol methylase
MLLKIKVNMVKVFLINNKFHSEFFLKNLFFKLSGVIWGYGLKKILNKVLGNPISYFLIQNFLRNFFLEQNFIKNKINISELNFVLDYGCSIGKFSELFPTSSYVGVDIDKNSLEFAYKKYKKNFVQIEKNKIPFKKNSFDLILLTLILHHIPESEIHILFGKLKELINNNGKIFILEISPARFQNFFVKIILFLEKKYRQINLLEEDKLITIINKNFEIKEKGVVKLGIYLAQFYILVKK